MNSEDSAQWLERIISAGDTPARRAIHASHFSSGAPRKLLSAFARLPLEHARVLDLGCGHGVYLARFSEHSVGLDADEQRVHFARSMGLDARQVDLMQDCWERGLGAFDYIWACDILPHVDDPVRLLREAQALLEPQGRLLISDWLWPDSRLARRLALMLPGARAVHDEPTHRHVVTRQLLRGWLAAAGLVIEQSWNPSFPHAWQRALVEPIWPPRTLVLRPRGQLLPRRA